MILSKIISIELNFGSFILYLSGILSGIIIAVLLYVLFALLSINKKKRIIESTKEDFKEEELRKMIEEARKNYQILIKSDDKEIKDSAFKNTIYSLVYDIASKCYPKSKNPLLEISGDETILLAKYIIQRVEELLDKKMLWIVRKASVRRIVSIFKTKKKIDNSAVIKEVKKYSKITKIGLTIVNSLKKPFVFLGKSVINKLLNKIMIITIGFVGEETYKIYTKQAIKSMDPEYQSFMEELEKDEEELEEIK